MDKKTKNIIIIAIPTIAIILGFVFLPWSDSYLGILVEPVLPIDWKEVHPRNVVKNSIPVTVTKEDGNNCKLSAENFGNIINHKYFVRGEEFASKMNFDSEKKTIELPCDILQGDTSKLNVWYVTEESPKHSMKYLTFSLLNFLTPCNLSQRL